MKYLTTFFILFISLKGQAEVSWKSMQHYNMGDLDFCLEAEQWINDNNNKTQDLINKGLTSIEGTTGFYILNVANNKPTDIFVVYASSGTCGSAGCSTKAFVKTDERCTEIQSPNWHFGKDIGFDTSSIYLGIPSKQCAIWTFDGANRLNHQGNIDNCGS
ncbi:hypothetical protein [Marinicellulosiphila megalodicopiae]|uniref:hypothetical protein n=1 Tax=Marinicellulosiphila megalodicopiae TaxID=2724896 RepID=UPI003BAF2450